MTTTTQLNKLEIRALQMMADGEVSKVIADKLGKSPTYIKQDFASNLFNKLGALNRPNAVAIAIRKGIIK